MRLVFLSYHYSQDIHTPESWFERISYYKGWAEILAKKHFVIRVDQIDYEGEVIYGDVKYLFIRPYDWSRFIPNKLHKSVKSLNPDIVVVSSFMQPLQILQLRWAVGKNVKILVQNHAEQPFNGLKKKLQRLASRFVDGFLFTSSETGFDWLKNRNLYRGNNIFSLPEVSSIFSPISKMSALAKTSARGIPIFLWVGRLNENKDPLVVVKSFIRFSETNPNTRLYMIFQTSELLEELKKLVKKHACTEQIIFLGTVSRNEMLYWYSCADYFISASHFEGSGTALCEAMSCGLVPIVTDIAPFRRIVGDAGFYFKPGDEEGLLYCIQNVVSLNLVEKREDVLDQFRSELSFEAIANKFQIIASSL